MDWKANLYDLAEILHKAEKKAEKKRKRNS
jgi:hypothetical protein